MVQQQTRKFYSPKQMAEEAETTTTAVMKLIRNKSIKAEKLGWVWMIPVTELPKVKDLLNPKKS